MADTGNQGMDYPAHEKTWDGFTAMMKWGTVGCALITALVVFLIAS
ncbi:aa3-type cytochrome c oxidase subunit IV [Sphingomonas soli]|nr:aa3-type cytochrome c oxidase subunit IV [Sphingomonas soli]